MVGNEDLQRRAETHKIKSRSGLEGYAEEASGIPQRITKHTPNKIRVRSVKEGVNFPEQIGL